jgi:hypothetical protein
MLFKLPQWRPNWIGPVIRADGEEVWYEADKATVAHFREAYRHSTDKKHEAYMPDWAAQLKEWLDIMEGLALEIGGELKADCPVIPTIETLVKEIDAERAPTKH